MVFKCTVRYGEPVAVEFAVLLLHLALAESVGEAQGQRIIDPEIHNEEEKVDAAFQSFKQKREKTKYKVIPLYFAVQVRRHVGAELTAKKHAIDKLIGKLLLLLLLFNGC